MLFLFLMLFIPDYMLPFYIQYVIQTSWEPVILISYEDHYFLKIFMTLICVKFVCSIGLDFFALRVMVFNHHILTSSSTKTLLLFSPHLYIHSFLWQCVLVLSGNEYVQILYLFVYICIAVGYQTFKKGRMIWTPLMFKPRHIFPTSSQDLKLSSPYVMVFFVFNDSI